jgi:hypothetical protein
MWMTERTRSMIQLSARCRLVCDSPPDEQKGIRPTLNGTRDSLLRGFIVDKINPIFRVGSDVLCFDRVEIACATQAGHGSRAFVTDRA